MIEKVNEYVSDEVIFDAYDNTVFTEDDFFCSAECKRKGESSLFEAQRLL